MQPSAILCYPLALRVCLVLFHSWSEFTLSFFSFLTANLKYYSPIAIFYIMDFLVDAFFLFALVSMQFARCLPMFVLFL